MHTSKVINAHFKYKEQGDKGILLIIKEKVFKATLLSIRSKVIRAHF